MNAIKEAQDEIDDRTKQTVLEIFKSGDDISITLIQIRCKAGYFSSYRTLKSLIKEGVIKKNNNIYKLV